MVIVINASLNHPCLPSNQIHLRCKHYIVWMHDDALGRSSATDPQAVRETRTIYLVDTSYDVLRTESSDGIVL